MTRKEVMSRLVYGCLSLALLAGLWLNGSPALSQEQQAESPVTEKTHTEEAEFLRFVTEWMTEIPATKKAASSKKCGCPTNCCVKEKECCCAASQAKSACCANAAAKAHSKYPCAQGQCTRHRFEQPKTENVSEVIQNLQRLQQFKELKKLLQAQQKQLEKLNAKMEKVLKENEDLRETILQTRYPTPFTAGVFLQQPAVYKIIIQQPNVASPAHWLPPELSYPHFVPLPWNNVEPIYYYSPAMSTTPIPMVNRQSRPTIGPETGISCIPLLIPNRIQPITLERIFYGDTPEESYEDPWNKLKNGFHIGVGTPF